MRDVSLLLELGARCRSPHCKGGRICSSKRRKLEYSTRFDSAPVYIAHKSNLQVAGKPTYSLRAKHVALQCLLTNELVEQGIISIRHIKTED